MKKILSLIALACMLQGCIFVVGAAAGAAAVGGVYEHRKVAQVVGDQRTTNDVIDAIVKIPGLRESSHIEVTTFNGVVLLTGQTPTEDSRKQIEETTHAVRNVTQVYNQITIQGPTSSLTRASDTWITTKIKAEMLTEKDLQSGTIKVLTENGAVYLMGIVSKEQSELAVKIARQVSGVQKVVKIFQYTN